MSELQALFLGLVQGLTEFLPVSSSGHLVIFESLLGVEQQGLLFEVTVHVATLVSVLIFYRRRIASLVSGSLRGRREDLLYGAKLALATAPAVVAVLLAGDFFDAQFDSPAVAGAGLLLTGAILWTTRSTEGRADLPEPGFGAAFLIGLAQVVAILPGVSRSGTTVAAALALGVAPLAAAEFSFLMSVVAVAGAAVRSMSELGAASPDARGVLLAGAAAAVVSGLAAIWLFVRLLRTQHFHRFAYYAWSVGAVFLLWLWFGGGGG